jgi:hypothetical protein
MADDMLKIMAQDKADENAQVLDGDIEMKE